MNLVVFSLVPEHFRVTFVALGESFVILFCLSSTITDIPQQVVTALHKSIILLDNDFIQYNVQEVRWDRTKWSSIFRMLSIRNACLQMFITNIRT